MIKKLPLALRSILLNLVKAELQTLQQKTFQILDFSKFILQIALYLPRVLFVAAAITTASFSELTT